MHEVVAAKPNEDDEEEVKKKPLMRPAHPLQQTHFPS
jgi:hypothetical protein